MAKIVARAQDWTHKWEITGKSRPRRHIAWPHDLVCSRWLAQAASEIVTYAKQMTIFNRSNFVHRIWCAYRSLGPQLPFGCLLVVFLFVFLSIGFLCLRYAGTLCHAGGAQKKC